MVEGETTGRIGPANSYIDDFVSNPQSARHHEDDIDLSPAPRVEHGKTRLDDVQHAPGGELPARAMGAFRSAPPTRTPPPPPPA